MLERRPFTVPEYRGFRGWLTQLALHTHKPVALADQLIERLRSDQIIVPPIQVVDRLCGEALARGTRVVYPVLTEPLDDDARARLDALLTPLGDTRTIRTSGGSCANRNCSLGQVPSDGSNGEPNAYFLMARSK